MKLNSLYFINVSFILVFEINNNNNNDNNKNRHLKEVKRFLKNKEIF